MIMGIDPGPEKSAYCAWDGSSIREARIINNPELAELLGGLGNETTVACEHLQCFGMAVGMNVFETAYWIGEFRAHCGDRFRRVYRGEVKMHHCRSMRAKDSNIRQALIDRFGEPGTKKQPGTTYGLKKDLWSAFAVAVFACDMDLARNE